jgi:hypothetical protein
MTKRELLISICENPGWHPIAHDASIERWLRELIEEGWIVPRLDGYEASARALTNFPDFVAQEEIAAPVSTTSVDPWTPEVVTLMPMRLQPGQQLVSPIEGEVGGQIALVNHMMRAVDVTVTLNIASTEKEG